MMVGSWVVVSMDLRVEECLIQAPEAKGQEGQPKEVVVIRAM